MNYLNAVSSIRLSPQWHRAYVLRSGKTAALLVLVRLNRTHAHVRTQPNKKISTVSTFFVPQVVFAHEHVYTAFEAFWRTILNLFSISDVTTNMLRLHYALLRLLEIR